MESDLPRYISLSPFGSSFSNVTSNREANLRVTSMEAWSITKNVILTYCSHRR